MMFTYGNPTDAPSFRITRESEATTWPAVTLNSATLYAFINYSFKVRRNWCFQTTVLWHSLDVFDFCLEMKGDKSRKIIDVFILEPMRIDANHSWRWSLVKEIYRLVDEESQVAFPAFITAQGETVSALGSPSLEELKISSDVVYVAEPH